MLDIQLTKEQKELLGNWSVTVSSYHQLNSLIAVFSNEIKELESLQKVVFSLGAPLNCFGNSFDILNERLSKTIEKKELIYQLLNS